ncbi:hypothetical protein GQ55_9G354000 [Panicum hallii var. hallii]|uniref:Uncharacterized protein n=1 Tax=Panicum hallii var. hallii TaxID=1504633 RepID=A0A2T7C8M0_9POAL|nr:hypothetical protein GQ55_9G354000 [Panicum hallii var. hallii]
MWVREGKRESAGSSRICSGSKRRHGEERASAGWGAAAQVLGRHVARGKAARGQQELGTWPVRAVGSGREETRGGGLEVDEGGLSCNFPNVQGLHCKT